MNSPEDDKQILNSGETMFDALPASPAWKRLTDLTVCVLALPALALLTLVMEVVLRIVSPGPVFFRQERVGYGGRRFYLYKFRTMNVNTDPRLHLNHVRSLVGSNAPMEKIESKLSSCLIPGAWLLRSSGLDELPQIINVLRGEMSMVGPRPCLPTEYELYEPWQLERFETQPGLTGLWQVSGKNRTTFEQMIRLDIQYAKTKTWAMDVKIMLKTPLALLVQMYEIKTGRRAQPVTPYTIPPFTEPVEERERTLESNIPMKTGMAGNLSEA
jgi:lipopolysaccharide/colanic/teichoic acid biosynthesis glycosyltransferase